MITLRNLVPADLPRMKEIVARGMEFDPDLPLVLAEKTFDAADFDPELAVGAVTADGTLAGFVMGALQAANMDGPLPAGTPLKGYIRLLVVEPAHCKNGAGRALLHEIENRLRARGAVSVAVMDCPHNYYMPGVDFRYTTAYSFLTKNGYEHHRANHNMAAPLVPEVWSTVDADAARCAADGLTLRRASAEDRDAIDAFLLKHWPAWCHEVHAALANNPVSLYVAFRGDECVAFSGYQGNNKALAWFGPMGTCPSLRGKGIGAVLLRLCLRDLGAQGHAEAIIPWVGPVGFYQKFCGARMDRCFYAYRKNLV